MKPRRGTAGKNVRPPADGAPPGQRHHAGGACLDASERPLNALSEASKQAPDPASIAPEIVAYVRPLARKRYLAFPEIANLVAARFGPAAPSPGEVAALACWVMAGNPRLNRLGRDPEMADWLRERMELGRIDDIRAACIREFGPDRTPSRTVLAAFLAACGRRGHPGRPQRLNADPEVAAFVLAEAPNRILSDLVAACMVKFGAERTPSRAAMGRYLKAEHVRSLGRLYRAETDPEIGVWLREHAPTMTIDSLHAGCKARFGAARTPGRASIHRFLSHGPGGKLTRRKGRLDVDAEVGAWVLANAYGKSLDELRDGAIAQFGPERAPSRSGLHRFLASTERARAPVQG